jgi:hypothetical protein
MSGTVEFGAPGELTERTAACGGASPPATLRAAANLLAIGDEPRSDRASLQSPHTAARGRSDLTDAQISSA